MRKLLLPVQISPLIQIYMLCTLFTRKNRRSLQGSVPIEVVAPRRTSGQNALMKKANKRIKRNRRVDLGTDDARQEESISYYCKGMWFLVGETGTVDPATLENGLLGEEDSRRFIE